MEIETPFADDPGYGHDVLLLVVTCWMVFLLCPAGSGDGNGAESVLLPCRHRPGWACSAFWWRLVAGIALPAHGQPQVGYRRAGSGRDRHGVLFIAIVTGSIWARPIWNTWWTWDPRLTTATIMELIYAAYLMLRQGIEDPDRRARFGAVYAIIGFISVPLTFLSIRIFRTIHPVVIGSSDPTAAGQLRYDPDDAADLPVQPVHFFGDLR